MDWKSASNSGSGRGQYCVFPRSCHRTSSSYAGCFPHNGLATADVRLSVLLAQPSTCFPGSVPTTTAPGSMVYGTQRAELDPVHAQRIIKVDAGGDEGLIALAGCEGSVRGIYSRGLVRTPQGLTENLNRSI